MLTDAVVERTQKLALATDGQKSPTEATGYTAAFHDMVRGVALVWAPCGCVLCVGASGDSLLTICTKPECSFLWRDAEDAYRLLVRPTPAEITGVAVTSAKPDAEISLEALE